MRRVIGRCVSRWTRRSSSPKVVASATAMATVAAAGLAASHRRLSGDDGRTLLEDRAACAGGEWLPDHADFDIYLPKEAVKKNDLLQLFRAYQDGMEVWPWVWTQPNDDGPHHVFVGPVSAETLRQIAHVKRTVPNANILVVTDRQSVQQLPDAEHSLYRYECGLVLDTDVALADFTNRMIMLEDERIISYTKLYAA